MAAARYRTAPEPIVGMPPGIPYIVANEAAERYSYYGMRAILVIFMTKYLMGRDGQLDLMTDEQATAWFHVFVTAVYSFPILGAILSDAFLGKYRTIMLLSIVYCLGHLTLAIDDTRVGLAIGLGAHRGRLGRHQAVRVRARGRPVREDQRVPAAEGVRVVLLLDQRRRACVHSFCRAAAPSLSARQSRLGFPAF